MKLTGAQERQIEFLRKMESREELSPQPRYNTYCRTCNEAIDHHAAITGIDFIRKHTGHKTWVDFLGRFKHKGV